MNKRALLIGINKYQVLGSLKYARNDAEEFADVLREHCGFEEHQITLMTCQSDGATRALSRFIELALLGLADEARLDCLVFGFWGHGFTSTTGRRLLCGIDTIEGDLERSAGNIVGKERLAFGLDNGSLVVLRCSSEQLMQAGWPKLLGSPENSGVAPVGE